MVKILLFQWLFSRSRACNIKKKSVYFTFWHSTVIDYDALIHGFRQCYDRVSCTTVWLRRSNPIYSPSIESRDACETYNELLFLRQLLFMELFNREQVIKCSAILNLPLMSRENRCTRPETVSVCDMRWHRINTPAVTVRHDASLLHGWTRIFPSMSYANTQFNLDSRGFREMSDGILPISA